MATAKKAPTTKLPRLRMPDMIRIFPVSHITIINWKNPKEGVEHRKDPLPHRKDPETGAVDYNARDVKRWADKFEVPYKIDPVAYAERLAAKQAKQAVPAPKPGPKPAAKKNVRAARAARKEVVTAPARKRTANPSRAGSLGDVAAKKNTETAARKRSKPIKKALVEASTQVQRKAEEQARDVKRIESKHAAKKARDTAPAPAGEEKPQSRTQRTLAAV